MAFHLYWEQTDVRTGRPVGNESALSTCQGGDALFFLVLRSEYRTPPPDRPIEVTVRSGHDECRGCLFFCSRYRARTVVHAGRTPGIFDRHRVEAPRAAFEKRIRDDKPALTAGTCFGLKTRLERQRIRVDIGFHIRICERIPPTRKAPTHVPNQTIMASFAPRSLSITISEAMQGTNNVMVTSATTIWSDVSGRS